MGERRETLVMAHYLLAVQGQAMMRSIQGRLGALPARAHDMRTILDGLDRDEDTEARPVAIHDVEEGYTRWAPGYDGPNPAIAREEPVVRELLAATPFGVALDAACGTGRLAAILAERGNRVIGVDATPAMLDRARAKLPDADLRAGRLDALPVDDASIDVLTCGLALTHVQHLAPVIAEFARVLRPGGHAVLSDMNPFVTSTGSPAAFRVEGDPTTMHFTPNLVHPVSTYVAAFIDAGLTILACREPDINEDVLAVFPSFEAFPEASRQAFLGVPYLLIWHLRKRG